MDSDNNPPLRSGYKSNLLLNIIYVIKHFEKHAEKN